MLTRALDGVKTPSTTGRAFSKSTSTALHESRFSRKTHFPWLPLPGVGSFFEADKRAAQDTLLPADLILSSQTWEEDGSWVKLIFAKI